MKRTIVLLLGTALVVVAAAFISDSFNVRTAAAGLFAPPADTIKGPKISFNEEVHDYGKIEQNTKVSNVFIIKSTGTDTLVIVSANASCGCTATVLGNKKLAPGDTTSLKITFDPHNKAEGPMVKTITVVSNAVNGAQKVLRVQGEIYKSKTAHKGESMTIQHVFEGDCASCHVDKGKGELGAKLYEADCAICHGLTQDHKPGPDIASEAMMSHDEKSWKKIIADGIKDSNMPAFHTRHKGPLNDEEIASLVDYLKAFKKNLLREKQLKSSTN